jgi:hypothetical protein
MGGACNMHVPNKDAFRILVGTPDEMRPLGRPRSRWEDNIKINLRATI